MKDDNPTNFIQLIKKISMDVYRESKPCDVVVGIVTKTSPLKIKISQKLILTGEFLVETKTFRESGTAKGDMVAMVRMSGGQSYLLLDKVVG